MTQQWHPRLGAGRPGLSPPQQLCHLRGSLPSPRSPFAHLGLGDDDIPWKS